MRTFSSFFRTKIFECYNQMPGTEKRVSRRRSSSKRKSTAQKRHQARAKEAMTLFKSGKASSLKAAWRKV